MPLQPPPRRRRAAALAPPTDCARAQLYMAETHEGIMKEFEPKIKALATTELHQQNFVYDDIE